VSQADRILLQVARCLHGDPPAPPHVGCQPIVSAQQGVGAAQFQVPEPWRGDLVNARLLFVSSNPALDPADDCPTACEPDSALITYYGSGFPAQFPRNVSRAGVVSARAVAFWSHLRNRAADCYGVGPVNIVPGTSFALTEVVHCKSNDEFGADAAAAECMRRHFGSVASLSQACVVVIFGRLAARLLGLNATPAVHDRDWYGKRRLLAWLPHPNARENRTFAKLYTASQMAMIRDPLR